MAIDLGATPSVEKRIRKGLPPGVQPAWDALKARLREDPQFVVPDKKVIWRKAFGDVPNHRHADLPDGSRAAWTIRGARVTVGFLGTHQEYERVYGF